MAAADSEMQSDTKMTEGSNQQPDEYPPRPRTYRLLRRDFAIRRVIPAILILLLTWTVFRSTFVIDNHYSPGGDERVGEGKNTIQDPVHSAKKLVPLEAHIMSKCPDAQDCLEQLVVPAMAQVSEKVNFTLSYIGSYDPDSDALSCKHGPPECLGNIIELCAAKIYPDPKLYLGFTNCMTHSYEDIPKRELVEGCAMEHGIDFQKLNSCISDEGEGADLLRASFERSRVNNVTLSCTVRLAGKIRCIRDYGEWYDCPGGSSVSDLVRDIEKMYG